MINEVFKLVQPKWDNGFITLINVYYKYINGSFNIDNENYYLKHNNLI
jgi:hypothetical protein